MSEETGYRAHVRAWAVEHHLPEAALNRWIDLGKSDALAILSVAMDLRLRTGQLLTAFEMLAEIGVREGEGAASILARRELRAVTTGSGSRPERARALLDKLRELRYPRLARLRAELEAAVAAMRLPHGLTVVLPKDLGSDEVMIRMTAHSAAELEKLIEALARHKERIKALIETLGGSDGI
ncbi:MAG TPA: hypothetical protein VKB84_08155 [Candidatus Binataceae bacterium]|nr:hypothetical protein [Candidatus Binataceae bacterium]